MSNERESFRLNEYAFTDTECTCYKLTQNEKIKSAQLHVACPCFPLQTKKSQGFILADKRTGKKDVLASFLRPEVASKVTHERSASAWSQRRLSKALLIASNGSLFGEKDCHESFLVSPDPSTALNSGQADGKSTTANDGAAWNANEATCYWARVIFLLAGNKHGLG